MANEPEQIILGDTAISAVERSARRRWFGRGKDRQPLPFTHCQNCDAELAGPHCAQCGQAAVDYRRSFRHVIVDVLDSFLNWDSKFTVSLWLLMSRPWRLTLDFLSGKRVRHMHPLRLYLLVSIAFFFGVHQLARNINLHTGPHHNLAPEEKAKLQERLSKLPPEVRDEVQKEVNESTKPKSEKAGEETDKPFLDIGTNPNNPNASPFEKWLNERAKAKIGENGVNARVFFLALIGNLPAMMLCCIPLFAFVLKILYLFRRVFYIDHFIYALHIHAFAYLAILLIGFIFAELRRVAPILSGWVMAALIVIALTQLVFSIRRVYRQSWFMSLFKFLFGGVIYLVVLLTGLAATFFVTLWWPD